MHPVQFVDEKHQYNSSGQCNCVCRVRIIPGLEMDLIVCSELPENAGTSITNKACQLAQEIVAKYNLNPDKIVWIEHYANPNEPQDFSLVELSWTGHKFTRPIWESLTIEQFRQILFRFVSEHGLTDALNSFLDI